THCYSLPVVTAAGWLRRSVPTPASNPTWPSAVWHSSHRDRVREQQDWQPMARCRPPFHSEARESATDETRIEPGYSARDFASVFLQCLIRGYHTSLLRDPVQCVNF